MDKDDEEKEGRVIQLRVLSGGGGASHEQAMAEHMRRSIRKAQMLGVLEHFRQRVLADELEFIAIASKAKPAPESNGEISTAIAPLDYKRFEVMGVLHSMLHFETLKLTMQREDHPVPEPPKNSG